MSLIPKRMDKSERFPAVSLRDEINRLFDDFFGGLTFQASKGDWSPALDATETDSEIVVKAEVPGMDPKDVEISLLGDVLTIKGEKKEETTQEGENYYRVERRYGSFHRSLTLPASVDAEKVNATCKDGVLTIKLEKKEESRPRSIEVKVE